MPLQYAEKKINAARSRGMARGKRPATGRDDAVSVRGGRNAVGGSPHEFLTKGP